MDRTTIVEPLTEGLVRSKDAAKFLAVSERTLWNLTKTGMIPVVRFGRMVRYDLADLQGFIIQFKEQKDERHCSNART